MDYKEEVKVKLCKLMDIVYSGKYRTLQIDTDEDCPYVYVWIPGNPVKVFGYHKESCISPPEGESWSFLECCDIAIKTIDFLNLKK